jgi:hypothetical protein
VPAADNRKTTVRLDIDAEAPADFPADVVDVVRVNAIRSAEGGPASVRSLP